MVEVIAGETEGARDELETGVEGGELDGMVAGDEVDARDEDVTRLTEPVRDVDETIVVDDLLLSVQGRLIGRSTYIDGAGIKLGLPVIVAVVRVEIHTGASVTVSVTPGVMETIVLDSMEV